MPNRFVFGGFNELRAQFTALPPELRADAEPIINDSAERAADQVRQAYHVVTGNLRAGVRVFYDKTISGARIVTRVVSGAPHAHLYEFGTVRSRAFPTFWPVMNRARPDMVRKVADMVRSHGLTVKGDAT